MNKILGTNMDEDKVIECLRKMGYNASKIGEDKIDVEIPAWRADILHDIDFVEDVAVGYGFDQFDTDFPKALTFGKNCIRVTNNTPAKIPPPKYSQTNRLFPINFSTKFPMNISEIIFTKR